MLLYLFMWAYIISKSTQLYHLLCKPFNHRLSGCLVSKKGFEALGLALESNPLHLRELDLSYNHPSEAELSRLSKRTKTAY